MRNLTICPSINRPNQIKEMVSSFYETQSISDLLILTEMKSITKLINEVDYSKYQFVTITNDDFVFRTLWWDVLLINSMKKPGFAYGFDLVNESLPTTCMIDCRIPKALGWIQLPTLEHLCGDMVWSHLGQKLNNIYFNKNVIIEHKHFLFGKAEKDDIYEKTNSVDMYRRDNEAFKKWVRSQSQEDVDKIKEGVLNG